MKHGMWKWGVLLLVLVCVTMGIDRLMTVFQPKPAYYLVPAALPGYPDAAYQCLLRLEPKDHTPGIPLTLVTTFWRP